MMSNTNKDTERQAFFFKLKLSSFIVGLWWIIEGIDFLIPLQLERFGMHPRVLADWWGIFTYPFLHGDLDHLMSNSLSGIILLTSLFIFHSKYAFRILTTLFIFSGALLWLIGDYGSNHIGASGLIYSLAFFLFTSGMIIRERNTWAVSFFIILWYGSMIWGIFPFGVENNVSWEGHLSGAIVGVITAFILYRKHLKHKPKYYGEDDDDDDFPFYEQYPLEENSSEIY